ncbi:MAG: hemerythrin domain-containing protein [Sideroxydans sp.]
MDSLFGTAAPGFDDPLEMLRACHGRITAQCTTLRKLQAHLTTHGHDSQAMQAAQAVLRYFDSAGQHHHQDEEQDLFPALRGSGNPLAAAHIERLLGEHAELENAWRALRPLLCAIADAHVDKLDDHLVTPFIHGYARHIEFENTQLLPLARTLLDAAELQRIGRNMAARRGLQT